MLAHYRRWVVIKYPLIAMLLTYFVIKILVVEELPVGLTPGAG
jgi:hypothetical protein